PSLRMIATVLEESSPPDSSTTARLIALGSPALGARTRSSPRHVPPQHLVDLQLQPDLQPILEDPVCEIRGRQLAVARREEDRTGHLVGPNERPRPFVVLAARDDELQRIAGRQQPKVLEAVARAFAGARRLHVDDPADPRIHAADVVRAAGLETDLVARIAEHLEKRQAAGLSERLAAGHTDVARSEARDPLEDLAARAPLAAAERIGRVAVSAAERTAGQPHEDGGPAGVEGLALDRMEDLADL